MAKSSLDKMKERLKKSSPKISKDQDVASTKIAEEVLGVFHDPAFHVAVPQPKPKLLVADHTSI